MNENPTINYSLALKNYSQNGKGCSMKKFCEDEGYDYDKSLKYSRCGQKEYSILKEVDERQEGGGFIPLVVDGSPDRGLGVSEVRVRFTNVTVHPLEEYVTLSEGEYYRTGKDGEIERSWYRIIIHYPERY